MGLAAIIIASFAPEDSGDQPPALWLWDDDLTLIEYQLEQLAEARVRDIEVVLGYGAEQIIPMIARDNVEPIIDARWASGRASSMRVGASAVPRGTDTALIVRVDEPRPSWVIEKLIDAHFDGGAAVTRPSFDSTIGAPVIIAESLLAALRNIGDDVPDLDAFVARHAADVALAPFDTPIVLRRVASATDCAVAQHEFSG